MHSLNCNGKLLMLDSPIIMGILNATPDSFFDGGKFSSEEKILLRLKEMISQGATIIDVGGQSTRPNAEIILVEEELNRVIPVIELVKKNFTDTIISIDTFHSEVAAKAVEAGASIINDISGGTLDEKMFDTVSNFSAPYILTHIQGTPTDMQMNPQYENVVSDVKDFFASRIEILRSKGVKDIILDVGFGFGKNLEHNFSLLKHLDEFLIFDLPILAGVSRKSMINRVLKTTPEQALNGTTVLNTLALTKGAQLLRVHDVKQAQEAIALFNQYDSAV